MQPLAPTVSWKPWYTRQCFAIHQVVHPIASGHPSRRATQRSCFNAPTEGADDAPIMTPTTTRVARPPAQGKARRGDPAVIH